MVDDLSVFTNVKIIVDEDLKNTPATVNLQVTLKNSNFLINYKMEYEEADFHCIPFIMKNLHLHRLKHSSSGRAAPPFFVGVNGMQGVGKTTLVSYFISSVPSHGCSCLLCFFSNSKALSCGIIVHDLLSFSFLFSRFVSHKLSLERIMRHMI